MYIKTDGRFITSLLLIVGTLSSQKRLVDDMRITNFLVSFLVLHSADAGINKKNCLCLVFVKFKGVSSIQVVILLRSPRC